ncbi:hypothetical protein PLESTB_000147800 [Pleodorina starrii]|uniref:Serine/threonine-protein phosphatase 4 regulatory subunit 2 n=1 Tax=Pleodorina starrii TaxID=330485 RepID=A0A9W6BB22_9CHLO|nr:hypothetical protein PLESTM_000446400 [Pleodorina starrii]GLC48784.1 hypothetical protein PLESTB_000147800 [Pleodorina starrii]GLC72525.1 hypothetical protein PLESTF_001260600 [Pleodorina starrii]
MATQAEPMADAAAASTGIDTGETERAGAPSESSAPSAYISSEADLIAFTRLPLEERVLTPQLRGVLAESALTGRIRYKWPLLRPLVDFVLEQVLTAYDVETRVEVGPPGPDSVSETIERFQKLLSAFSDAPWTFQRLCEILLEPKRQYSRLPKLVLAIEKCLLVTTEQPPTEPDQLPPPPLCSSLGPVNTNPAPVYTNAHHGSHGGHGAGPSGVADDSAAFTNSLLDTRHHPHHHHHVGNHVGTPEHIEEDHWPEGLPEGKGAFKAAGVGVGLHGGIRPGSGSPGSGGASTSGGSGGSPTKAVASHDGHGPHPSTAGGATDGAVAPGPASGSHGILSVLGAAGSCGGGTAAAVTGSSGTNRDSTGGAAQGSGEDAMMVDGGASQAGPADRNASVTDGSGLTAPASGQEQQQQQRLHADDGRDGGDNRQGPSKDAAPSAVAAESCTELQPPAVVVRSRRADGDVEMEPAESGVASVAAAATAGEQGPGDQQHTGEPLPADAGAVSATMVLKEAVEIDGEPWAGANPAAPVGAPPPVG